MCGSPHGQCASCEIPWWGPYPAGCSGKRKSDPLTESGCTVPVPLMTCNWKALCVRTQDVSLSTERVDGGTVCNYGRTGWWPLMEIGEEIGRPSCKVHVHLLKQNVASIHHTFAASAAQFLRTNSPRQRSVAGVGGYWLQPHVWPRQDLLLLPPNDSIPWNYCICYTVTSYDKIGKLSHPK